MVQNLEAFMRLGIVHAMAFPELAGGEGPWADTVRQIALDPFFTAIEITHIKDSRERGRVKEIMGLARLSVDFGSQPVILGQGLNLNALDEKERSHAVSVLKENLDEAAEMGAEKFAVMSGRDPGQEKRTAAVEALLRSLAELCDYSSKRGGPKIVAEVFDCDMDKCCLLGPNRLAGEVADRMRRQHENFGLLVDLSHIPLLKESPEEALGPVQASLAGVHLGNAVLDPACAGYGDNHPIFGSPGSVNDVPEVAAFLGTLLDLGFLGLDTRPIVSFEIKPMQGQDPLLMIANAKRVLKEAWTRVGPREL